VVVLGNSGAGKSTLSAAIAAHFGLRHVELDGLFHGPGWTPTPMHEFRAKVARIAEEPAWVFDGNYMDKVSDILWPRADTVVWLDLPLSVLLPRLVKRTLGRIVRRTELWNSNREGWSGVIGRDALLNWAIQSQRRHHAEMPGMLAEHVSPGATVVRLTLPREVKAWQRELMADTSDVRTAD
jgi:adenylate kinase family enzyme